jgi:hypothetical protein
MRHHQDRAQKGQHRQQPPDLDPSLLHRQRPGQDHRGRRRDRHHGSGSRFGRVIAVISTAASSRTAPQRGPASAPDAVLAADRAWVPSLAARLTIVGPSRRSLA